MQDILHSIPNMLHEYNYYMPEWSKVTSDLKNLALGRAQKTAFFFFWPKRVQTMTNDTVVLLIYHCTITTLSVVARYFAAAITTVNCDKQVEFFLKKSQSRYGRGC